MEGYAGWQGSLLEAPEQAVIWLARVSWSSARASATFCKEQLHPGLLAGTEPAGYDFLLCLALVRLHVEHCAQTRNLQYKKTPLRYCLEPSSAPLCRSRLEQRVYKLRLQELSLFGLEKGRLRIRSPYCCLQLSAWRV